MKKVLKNFCAAMLVVIMAASPVLGAVVQVESSHVTRGQFAAMVSETFGLPAESANGFTDVAIDHPFATGIAGMQAQGFILGDGMGNFSPNAYISGAEAAVILNNMIGFDGSLVPQVDLDIPAWAVPSASVLLDLTMIDEELILLNQLTTEQANKFIDAVVLAFMIAPGTPYALEQHRLQDNFHGYVNRQFLATGAFHPGHMIAGSFNDVTELVRQQNEQILFDILNNTNPTVGSNEWKIRELYNMFLDNDARVASFELIVPYLDMVRDTETIEELLDLTMYLGYYFDLIPFFSIDFIADSYNDATRWAALINEAGLSLGSRDLYADIPELAHIHQEYINLYAQILYHLGETGDLQQRAASIFDIEQQRAARMMPVEYAGSFIGMFTPVTWEDALEAFGNVPSMMLYGDFFDNIVSEMTVYSRSLDYIAFINSLYVDDNLAVLQDVALVSIFTSMMNVLDDEFDRLLDDLDIALIGQAPGAGLTIEDRAQSFVTNTMWRTFSHAYYTRFSSQELKDYGIQMAEEIRDTMREMIWEIDWMSDETKALSVEKLDSVTVYIAFPDTPIQELDVVVRPIEEGGNLVEFIRSFNMAEMEMWYHRLQGPANVSLWELIPTSTVNAFYNPMQNKVVMTAGIMQYPFFCLNNTREQNLGSFGAIIAHEFIHAFDPQGSQFDKYGTISGWWAEEDAINFATYIDNVTRLLGDLEFAGAPVNGTLIVNEFVTDLGAMEVIMTLIERTGGDQTLAMEQWARTWKARISQEVAQFIMMTAVHPPAMMRANMVISQLEEFYALFDVVAGDDMYVPTEERISFWR